MAGSLEFRLAGLFGVNIQCPQRIVTEHGSLRKRRDEKTGDVVFDSESKVQLEMFRELRTIESIGKCRMTLNVDNDHPVEIDPAKPPHPDHGYAVTSYSSPGQTADRVLINVDTELGAEDLLMIALIMSLFRAGRRMRNSSHMTGSSLRSTEA